MSRIIFQESYIIIVPSFKRVSVHKHPLLHLFVSNENCCVKVQDRSIVGQVVMVDSNVNHELLEGNECNVFVLITKDSYLAQQLKERYIKKELSCVIEQTKVKLPEQMERLSEEEIIQYVKNLFASLELSTKERIAKDERIEQLLQYLQESKWLHRKVSKMAEQLCLSESRLTHLFKEAMGISLQSYIVLRKMEYAYKLVLSGRSITYSALEAGFASPAHLAFTCKRLTGISIRDVLR